MVSVGRPHRSDAVHPRVVPDDDALVGAVGVHQPQVVPLRRVDPSPLDGQGLAVGRHGEGLRRARCRPGCGSGHRRANRPGCRSRRAMYSSGPVRRPLDDRWRRPRSALRMLAGFGVEHPASSATLVACCHGVFRRRTRPGGRRATRSGTVRSSSPSSSIRFATDASPSAVTSAMTSAASVQPASSLPVASPKASEPSGAKAGQIRAMPSSSDPKTRCAGSPARTSEMSLCWPAGGEGDPVTRRLSRAVVGDRRCGDGAARWRRRTGGAAGCHGHQKRDGERGGPRRVGTPTARTDGGGHVIAHRVLQLWKSFRRKDRHRADALWRLPQDGGRRGAVDGNCEQRRAGAHVT